jgi:hypothetical protein
MHSAIYGPLHLIPSKEKKQNKKLWFNQVKAGYFDQELSFVLFPHHGFFLGGHG